MAGDEDRDIQNEGSPGDFPAAESAAWAGLRA